MKLKPHILKNYSETANFIKENFSEKIDISIVAGSGFANYFDNATELIAFNYNFLPRIPKPKVEGHNGILKIVNFGGKCCLLFLGRTHFYEGSSVDEVASFSIISHLLGAKSIILTNAAGGLNPNFQIGDAMLNNDFINLLFRSSAEVFDDEYLMNRTNILSNDWSVQVKNEIVNSGKKYVEGVYLSTLGPSYETPAEIRSFRRLGADAAGMSTIIEAEVAAKLGLNVLSISLITNILNEVQTAQISHDEIIDASIFAKENMQSILEIAVKMSEC